MSDLPEGPKPGRLSRPARAVLFALALALAGLGAYLAGVQLWAWHHYREAQRLLLRYDFDRAREHLARSLRVWTKSGEAHFLAARTARRADAYRDAEQLLTRCKELGWSAEDVALEGALLQAQRGDPAPVETYLVGLVRQDHPDATLILEALAQGYMQAFDLRRTFRCLDEWLEREPDSPQALYQRGVVHGRMRHHAEAIADLSRAVELFPEHEQARLHLGDLFLSIGRYQDAVVHYEYLYERLPDQPLIARGLARCRHGQGRPEEAERLLDLLLEKHPRDSAALGDRGRLALQAGRADEAEDLLRRALAEDPYNTEAMYTLGLCLTERNKPEEAREWVARRERTEADLRRIDEIFAELLKRPGDAGLRREAGVLYLRSGQEREGLRWLESALKADPRHRPAHQALAEHFERKGRSDLAEYHRRLAGQGTN